DLRHETPGLRLGRGELLPGGEPLEGAGGPEDARDEVRPARVRDQADVDEGRDEARGVRREAHVARAGKGHARAGRDAVDGGDDRLLERPKGADVRVVVLAQARADVSGRLAELGQVLPDAEAAA